MSVLSHRGLRRSQKRKLPRAEDKDLDLDPSMALHETALPIAPPRGRGNYYFPLAFLLEATTAARHASVSFVVAPRGMRKKTTPVRSQGTVRVVLASSAIASRREDFVKRTRSNPSTSDELDSG